MPLITTAPQSLSRRFSVAPMMDWMDLSPNPLLRLLGAAFFVVPVANI
jgi:tRNA-dihydrouridine synthase A